MGEALIARGMVMDPNSIVRKIIRLKTDIITENKIWEVPGNCLNEKGISVRIFGGGGGAGIAGGGGGGWMNNAILNLAIYESIQVNIGNGAIYNNTGGTTFFGSFLSANGGESTKYTFMGPGICAGNGGSGGGGSMGMSYEGMTNGGQGYQFGGGGASGMMELVDPSNDQMNNWYNKHAGNGGLYGGGGGSIAYKLNSGAKNITGGIGIGGIYGGNGGTNTQIAQDGTNISEIDIPIFGNELHGYPMEGSNGGYCGGGGGYGGNGGKGNSSTIERDSDISSGLKTATGGGGGGGGYRANGGNGSGPIRYRSWTSTSKGEMWVNYIHPGAGGGGGGYGGKGADAYTLANGYVVGGGGGGYGLANYGSGGGNSLNTNNNHYGVHGVCVIQYYMQD